jgi:hypothetical protein
MENNHDPTKDFIEGKYLFFYVKNFILQQGLIQLHLLQHHSVQIHHPMLEWIVV